MNPNAPAANPTTSNTNQPFGGFGQAQSDYSTASNILNFLPTQERQTTSAATNANSNPGSILPDININAPTYTAPTSQVLNAGSYGTDLQRYNADVQKAEQSQIATENSTFGQAQGQLSAAEKQYGNLTPIYQNLAAQYNIPGYQKDIATLSGLLENLNKDVNAQTTLGGGLMTQSARDEMYANEANPLNTALNNAGQFLQYGQTDVNNLLGTYEKSLTNALTPLETNISNLPTLFGQANSATEAGYNQGEQTIQNSIQNQIANRQAAAAESQAASFAREVAAQYGGGAGATGGIAGILNPQHGVTTTAPQPGSKIGFNFNAGGKPVSAMTWAAQNGQDPATIIAYMAQQGDATAGRAYQAMVSNPSLSAADIARQFPQLGSGFSPAPSPTQTPSSARPSGGTNFAGGQTGSPDLFNRNVGSIFNFLGGVL